MSRLMMPTLNERSGLVHVRYRRLPTRLQYLFASTCSSLSYFESFTPGSIGNDIGLQFSILYFFKISFAYVSYDIKIPVSPCLTSKPMKNFNKPKSVISNSRVIVLLNSSIISHCCLKKRGHRHKEQ